MRPGDHKYSSWFNWANQSITAATTAEGHPRLVLEVEVRRARLDDVETMVEMYYNMTCVEHHTSLLYDGDGAREVVGQMLRKRIESHEYNVLIARDADCGNIHGWICYGRYDDRADTDLVLEWNAALVKSLENTEGNENDHGIMPRKSVSEEIQATFREAQFHKPFESHWVIHTIVNQRYHELYAVVFDALIREVINDAERSGEVIWVQTGESQVSKFEMQGFETVKNVILDLGQFRARQRQEGWAVQELEPLGEFKWFFMKYSKAVRPPGAEDNE